MTIRPYRPEDREAVLALWLASDLVRPWNDPGKDIDRKLGFQPEGFLVGEEEGEIVGSVMAGYDGHRGWVYYLAVVPGSRGRGHGRRLMGAAEQALQALGAPKLNLQVREGNAAAGFYAAIGYEREDRENFGRRLEADGK